MLLKTLAINLVFFLTILTQVKNAEAQECKRVMDDQGVIEGFLEVDGVVFKMFEKDKAVEMLVKLRQYELQKEEISGLNLKLDLLQSIVQEQEFMVTILKKNNEADRELLEMALGKKSSWYTQDYVVAIASFAVVSLAYGYWSLATK